MSQPAGNPENTDDARAETQSMQERARRAWLWLVQYWKALFDFSFEKYMIIQMLPILYGMMLFAIAAGILYLIVEAFASGSHWRGFFYLFFAGPLGFVALASLLRATIEFYIVIFRIAEDVDELIGIRDTVDKLSGIQDTVDEVASLTRRIPFWKVIIGKTPKPRRLSNERRQAEQAAERRSGRDRRAGQTRPPDGD